MGIIDSALEWPIAPSFTRIGPLVRSRTEGWQDLDTYDLTGRHIIITGATSGLGLAAAHQLAQMGASLVAIGRDAAKTDAVAASSRLQPALTTQPPTPTSAISLRYELSGSTCSPNTPKATR